MQTVCRRCHLVNFRIQFLLSTKISMQKFCSLPKAPKRPEVFRGNKATKWILQEYANAGCWRDADSYPRPVLAFAYCRCLCLCVHVSVRHQVCPRDISWTVQARITKFDTEMQNKLLKIPIVVWDIWPWPSRSNWTPKSKFTPFLAYLLHYSSPIQARITKFGPEVQNTLVKVPVGCGIDCCWSSWSNLTLSLKFHARLICPLEKLHDSHVESLMPGWYLIAISLPRLFHSPDSFTVSTLCTYTDLVE